MTKSIAVIGTRGYPSYYGGFETLVRWLAPYLADSEWAVSVYGRRSAIKVSDTGADPRIASIMTPGLDTKSVSTLSYGFVSVVHAMVRKPDVALIMNVANGYWIPLLKLRSIPTIVNVDGIEWEREKWNRIARIVFKIGAKLTARFANEIVCDARAIANRWDEEFNRRSTYIPYGGTSFKSIDPPTGLKSRSYVLIVARFVPENTIEQFLDAIPRITEVAPVVIVGSSGYGGPIDERVHRIAESNSNVEWYGHISNDDLLFGLWAHAGVYFHGHSVGGTNPALVQAMACAAPILARDTVYNREVLGEHGEFVEPSADRIAARVLGIMADHDGQQSMADDAYSRAQEYFTWERICSQYEELCAQLAGHDKRARPADTEQNTNQLGHAPTIRGTSR